MKKITSVPGSFSAGLFKARGGRIELILELGSHYRSSVYTPAYMKLVLNKQSLKRLQNNLNNILTTKGK